MYYIDRINVAIKHGKHRREFAYNMYTGINKNNAVSYITVENIKIEYLSIFTA